jgi:hypothetical protein
MKGMFLVILVVILIVGLPASHTIELTQEDIIDAVTWKMYLYAETLYNPEGYWGKAGPERDVRYNEVILFYNFIKRHYGVNNDAKIMTSIDYSCAHLRSPQGAFLQEGQESYMRTAMYITAICEVLQEDSRLFADGDELLDTLRASAEWLFNARHDNFNGNQDLAAMLAFYEMALLTNGEDSWQYFGVLRARVRETFIFEEDGKGYLPEAPTSWDNRLNVPYLQVQAFILGFYLLLNPSDGEMKNLFDALVGEYHSFLDEKDCTLNVEDSLGHYSEDEVPISVPSVLWLACKFTNKLCSTVNASGGRIVASSFQRLNAANTELKDILICTDAFWRYGIINWILHEETER